MITVIDLFGFILSKMGLFTPTQAMSARCTCGTGWRRGAQPAEEGGRVTPPQLRTQSCDCQSLEEEIGEEEEEEGESSVACQQRARELGVCVMFAFIFASSVDLMMYKV